MGYGLLADATMVVHFLFLVFVTTGGFLALRWRWVIWPHLAAAAWGLASVLFGVLCPLTTVENWARDKAGEHGLARDGFIDTYIEGVIYPERYTLLARLLVLVAVLVSWALLVLRTRRARHPTQPPPHPQFEGRILED